MNVWVGTFWQKLDKYETSLFEWNIFGKEQNSPFGLKCNILLLSVYVFLRQGVVILRVEK